MVFHRWPFIKTCLFENFQGLYERSMGLKGIVFFFAPSSFLLPSNSEATGMSYQPEPLVYLIPPPQEIVLGSYVKSFYIIVMYYSNINKMSCFYLFVFLFLFYMFIFILVYEFQSLKL